MDNLILKELKDSGYIFNKYTGVETGETFDIYSETLMVPTIEELTKAGVGYFDDKDKLDTKEEIASVWIAKNSIKKLEVDAEFEASVLTQTEK